MTTPTIEKNEFENLKTYGSDVSSSRRSFLKNLSLAGGGLIVGLPLTACANAHLPNSSEGALQPNALLQISSDNQVNFYVPRSEMGQGIYTGLTTIVAEELDIDPKSINIIHAAAHDDYNNPEYGMQITGGSTSVRAHFLPLRQLAANTRLVLRQAASQQLKLDLASITTDNGKIVVNGKALPYGDFADFASTMDFPENALLKDKSQFKYMGKMAPRLDGVSKSTGTAKFGIDVDFEGLYRTALKRTPVFGGTVKSFDSTQAETMPGVKAVVKIHNGVAVVADHYYQAKNALTALKIEWDFPETLSKFSSDSTASDNGKGLFTTALNSDDSTNSSEEGDGIDGLKNSDSIVTGEYWAPYLAHSTMEPMNCTAKIDGDKMELWVGSQAPTVAKLTAAYYTDISPDNVTVNSTFLGGGFGRRSGTDFIAEAAAIAKASGLPVQLVWSREDDMKHGLYRPASLARFKIGLNQQGLIDTWTVKRSGPQIMPYTLDSMIDAILPSFLPNGMVDWLSKRGYGIFDSLTVDHTSVEGLSEDYDAPHKSSDHVTADPGLPLGYWRAVGHSFSGFFKESMMDEIAVLQKQDAVEYRLKHLTKNPKLANTLTIAAEKAGWNKPLPKGHFHGVAAHSSFNSHVSQVAEVSVENNKLKIHKVVCVVDCGLAINPGIVQAQMESGIIYGLTAALYGEITLKDGVVQQSNFHDYPALRMNETPDIEVIIVESDEAPTGVGEPGLPPVAAAVANAIYAATGKRLRSLPLKLS
ncbi:MAG: CO/xanthine dehydrogenase Mo-binding subunit [Crocinitomicaceae bacterium]|jgi:CO/xanthine dehydrogenase Mo-binding subunit